MHRRNFKKIPTKSECPYIWIRLPKHKWPKSWSCIEDPVVRPSRDSRKEFVRSLPGLLGRAVGDSSIETWLGECLFFNREKGLFSNLWMWMTSNWLEKKQNVNPMWKVLNKEVDLGEPTSFLASCILGMHSTTMPNKQRYCGQLQNHVWIANFSGSEQKSITMLGKSSYLFMVSWYGRSCEEMCGAILWVGKQDDSTTLQSIYSMHRWPPFQRRRNEICWRIVTSMLTNCSKMPEQSKRTCLVCACGRYQTGRQDSKHRTDLEDSLEGCWSGRTNIISWSRKFWSHSKRVSNQFESRISAGAKEKTTLFWETRRRHVFVVQWYGRSREGMCGKILRTCEWKNWTFFQSPRHAWMTINLRRRRSWISCRINCPQVAHKLFWNVYTWLVLVGLILYGQWTNLHVLWRNGQKLVINASHVWSHTFITHVNTGKIVMWWTQHNIADWWLFEDSDFAGDLEDSKSPSGGILCIFGSQTFVPKSRMCKKPQFHTVLRKLKSFLSRCRFTHERYFPLSIFGI